MSRQRLVGAPHRDDRSSLRSFLLPSCFPSEPVSPCSWRYGAGLQAGEGLVLRGVAEGGDVGSDSLSAQACNHCLEYLYTHPGRVSVWVELLLHLLKGMDVVPEIPQWVAKLLDV